MLFRTKMKSVTKLVLIGLIAIIGVSFWQKHSARETPSPAEFVSRPAILPAPSPDPAPAALQAMPSQPPSNPFEKTMALIHLKLHRWLEAQKRGAEEEETQSMQELQALLTDENTAEITRSLSTDELETPLGLEGIRRWMNADPVQASNWIAARPDATQDQTGAVAQGWVANSAGLQNFLDQLPDTAWKQNFLQEVVSQTSAKDPAAAVKLAQQMTPGSDQTSLLQSAACNWVANDPNAALDWITSVNDPILQEQLVVSAAQSYALSNPAQAAAWLVSAVKSDEMVKEAALNIAQTWVTKDPAGAARWVSQFPDGDAKTAAEEIVSKYWQAVDSTAANAWIQTLSGQPTTPTN
jgi:hypothetical protein